MELWNWLGTAGLDRGIRGRRGPDRQRDKEVDIIDGFLKGL